MFKKFIHPIFLEKFVQGGRENMKKLKTFCACAGLAAMLSVPAFAIEQKFNVPTYDIENPVKTIELHSEMTVMGQFQNVAKENLVEGKKYTKSTFKLYDRDKDGNTDLIRLETESPELKLKDLAGYSDMKQELGEEALKKYYGENYEEKLIQPKSKSIHLAIDEEFNGGYDGFVERTLSDVYNEEGEPFADGKFDQEKYTSPKITDFIPPE